MSVAALSTAHRIAQNLVLERARIEVAMRSIYDLTGNFSAVAETSAACLLALAEQVREQGGELGGWVA